MGMEKNEILNWTRADPGERRLQEVLTLLFSKHPRLLEFLFEHDHPRLRDEPGVLLEQARVFSSGEKILVRVALDLWSGQGNAHLSDAIDRLDLTNYNLFLAALRRLRPETEYDPLLLLASFRQS